MKKVLIIAPFLSGNGGTETVLGTVLSDKEINNKLDLHLLISGGNQGDWLSKYSVNQNQVNATKSRSKVIQLFMLIKELIFADATTVIAMTGKIIYISWLVRKIFRKKYRIYSWIHFSIFDEANVSHQYLHLADRHLAISTGIVDQLVELGISRDKCDLVFNPVELSDGTSKFDDRSNELIYIGRPELDGQKNIRELFLILKSFSSSWHLSIYGSGRDMSEVESFVHSDSELVDKVKFFGWVANPWEQITSARCLVLTSNYEGFPMVLLEAANNGLPVLSSNCPVGPADIVKKGINGQLYHLGDIEDGQQKLLELWNQSSNFDSAKIKDTVNEFSTQNYAKRFLNALG